MSLWNILTRGEHDLRKYAASRLQFRLPTDPVPAAWSDILARNVPLARTLSDADRDRLLRIARLLLHEVPFEGCRGLVLTDEIRVTIAATASLLLYGLPYPRFTKLVRVLVYPETFVPKRAASRHDSLVTAPEPTLGEAWNDGVVILSWDRVRHDAGDHNLEGSVVLHEMAHILDAEDGTLDGTPVFDDGTQGAAWAPVLTREFGREQAAVSAGEDPPLDGYASRSHAEFFAVATEAFYCTPDRLRAKLPDLYEQLRRFYRCAPSSTASATPATTPEPDQRPAPRH